jgi:hypothetical protein
LGRDITKAITVAAIPTYGVVKWSL